MADIRTTWTGTGADWAISGPSLAGDDGLETAVVISLFTDRLAVAGDTDVAPTQRRGWWGDAYAEVDGDLIGSRLWTLRREKQTPAVLARAELYAREALQWLIDDGVASAVAVSAEWMSTGVMAMRITITRSAAPVVSLRFESFWKGA